MSLSYPQLGISVSSGGTVLATKTWTGAQDECELGIAAFNGTTIAPLEVTFTAVALNVDTLIHAISNIRLERFESATQQYIYKNNSVYLHEYKITGGTGYEHGEVTVNRLREGSTISGTDHANILNMDPDYPYMLVPQKLLTLPVTLNSHISPANIYCDKYTDWGDNTTQRRIIARSFEPWNDKTTLLLHSY